MGERATIAENVDALAPETPPAPAQCLDERQFQDTVDAAHRVREQSEDYRSVLMDGGLVNAIHHGGSQECCRKKNLLLKHIAVSWAGQQELLQSAPWKSCNFHCLFPPWNASPNPGLFRKNPLLLPC